MLRKVILEQEGRFIYKLSLLLFLISCNSYSINNNKIRSYCRNNGFNDEYCILVDYSKYSGSKRLMIQDLSTNKILYSCKCAHGNDGSEKMEANIHSFSNIPRSNKSSLGKYKIGKRRKINSINGMFDISILNIPCYELYGLDKTNSNAYKRGILIHPDPTMDNSILPLLPWHSLGCFSIPYSGFNEINKYIKKSKKPILLIAYFGEENLNNYIK